MQAKERNPVVRISEKVQIAEAIQKLCDKRSPLSRFERAVVVVNLRLQLFGALCEHLDLLLTVSEATAAALSSGRTDLVSGKILTRLSVQVNAIIKVPLPIRRRRA